MNQRKMLDGKVAIVTGGGRGIGRGIALALGAAGATVVVNDIGAPLEGGDADSAPANDVAREIVQAGGRAVASLASVTDHAATREMVMGAAEEFGRLDILVHSAGILRDRMIFNMSEAEWDPVIEVHLKGYFNLLRPATELMRAQRSGRIIALASGSAYGDAGQPNYSAAKAGMVGLTYSTARAMAKYGVTANTILPSGTTRMIDSKPESKKIHEETGKWPSELAIGTPRDPNNVAPLVVFLASDRAVGVNCQVFHSYGFGYTLIDQPRTLARLESTQAWTPEALADAYDEMMAPDLPAPADMPFGRDFEAAPETEWREVSGKARYWRRARKDA